ncbi:YqaA family protein [Granulicella sibirica]|uniref:DedA family protein n=1 Tax=Granulicella sibirica TaxID=2479048 RepID=A0A4Q0T9M0_9BACT|nr:VTT domain-containing protein [Granulicella sibirica]RXH58808.1 DedA family protein [Granulicella sibirica]
MILSTLLSPASLFHKFNLALLAFLKPFGVWGLGGLALLDSSSIPMPIDALVIDYVVQDHARFVLYCLMAALGSAVGSMVPYYLGRAGGELILLKRINRTRYEKLRDRFEKQEFLAIMVPAMMPPPMPVKLFEIAAGVFEMKPLTYFLAILIGKFLRFLVETLITVIYGRTLLATVMQTFRQHSGIMIAVVGVVVILLALFVVRRLFDRRRGTKFPMEEAEDSLSAPGEE